MSLFNFYADLPSLADQSVRTYNSQYRMYLGFCQAENLEIGEKSVEQFIASLINNEKSPSTITVAIAAIRDNFDFNLSNRAKRAIKNYRKASPLSQGQKNISPDVYRPKMTDSYKKAKTSLIAARNHFLACLALQTGMRNHTLRYLKWGHISLPNSNKTLLKLTLPAKAIKRSKKETAIAVTPAKNLAVCPIEALCIFWRQARQKGLPATNIQDWHIFGRSANGQVTQHGLSGQSINNIIKNIFGNEYSCHSLRKTFVVENIKKGTSLPTIQGQTKHTSFRGLQAYTTDHDICQTANQTSIN